jgi:hypothetical protein
LAAFYQLFGGVKMRRLLMRVTEKLPAREITRSEGAPYLERYYLGQLFGWTFYLHRFLAGDEGTHLHDHPWRLSLSLILSGWYRETRIKRITGRCVVTKGRALRPGWLNIIRGIDFHRIDLPDGREAWTLFAHGRRYKRWGFLRWRWYGFEHFRIDYELYPRPSKEELRWHETAPTGAQLREEQRLRAAGRVL